MQYTYKTQGTCSVAIDIEMDGDIIKNVNFVGGCNGNLKAISNLVRGMRYDDVKEKLEGITCGYKPTSCGDQLVKGLTEALEASRAEK